MDEIVPAWLKPWLLAGGGFVVLVAMVSIQFAIGEVIWVLATVAFLSFIALVTGIGWFLVR